MNCESAKGRAISRKTTTKSSVDEVKEGERGHFFFSSRMKNHAAS